MIDFFKIQILASSVPITDSRVPSIPRSVRYPLNLQTAQIPEKHGSSANHKATRILEKGLSRNGGIETVRLKNAWSRSKIELAAYDLDRETRGCGPHIAAPTERAQVDDSGALPEHSGASRRGDSLMTNHNHRRSETIRSDGVKQ